MERDFRNLQIHTLSNDIDPKPIQAEINMRLLLWSSELPNNSPHTLTIPSKLVRKCTMRKIDELHERCVDERNCVLTGKR